jgi:putative serine/threonine protein kinase
LQATPSERVPLEGLLRTPFIQVLTYPKISLRTARGRIRQLEKLGVDTFIFEGRARIGRLGLLGVGTVGLVVGCTARGSVCALKIRRRDANRPSLDDEYEITRFVNRLGIGATAYDHSKDFLLMKHLDYTELSDWLRELRGQGTRRRARDMLHEVLNQCRKLDIMGVDHGQLSNLRKHVVVADGRPWIIDFESASRSRRPSNVTSAAQYLLVGGRVSPLVRRLLGVRDIKKILELLRQYKAGLNDIAYAKLLEQLRLATD